VLRLLQPEAVEAEETNPYPGLAPFTEQEAGCFFGREAEIGALWEKIEERRLLALIGPSGAGKTSFLRAGVIPARPEGWRAVYATPGASPALNLARSLTGELAGDAEALRELLAGVAELTAGGDPRSLTAVLRQWRHRHSEVLLVLDQFEELFTLNPVEVQRQFAALVGSLADDAGLHVVLSMRDDFLIRCCEHPALAPVFEALTPLPPLQHGGLRRALEDPAARQGYRFEDEALMDRIVAAVEGERGSLPLLAFAVSRLWEKRDRENQLLTRESYQEIGGVEGALAGHAEATLERIPVEHQNVVREFFRNLVTAQGTRAVIDREELLSVFPDRATAEEVLRLLVNARLLTTYEVNGKEGETAHHRVEVVHESLLTAWPRLVRWQAQDQEGAVLRDELRQAARSWDQHGRPADRLWTSTAYREFALWRERYPGALTSLEEEFARSMTEQAKRKKRLVRLSVAAAFLLVIAVATVVTVLWQRSVESESLAQDEARRAEASKLLAIAQLRLEEDPTEALVYSTACLELHDSEAARLMALQALAKGPPVLELAHGMSIMTPPTFSPDGKRVALGTYSTEIGVWNEDGSPVARLPGHYPTGTAVAWADNDLLVTGQVVEKLRSVRIWSIPGGKELRRMEWEGPGWWRVRRRRLYGGPVRTRSDGHEIFEVKSWELPDGVEQSLPPFDWTEVFGKSPFSPLVKGGLFAGGPFLFSDGLPVSDGDIQFLKTRAARLSALGSMGPDGYWLSEKGGSVYAWSYPDSGSARVVEWKKPAKAEGSLIPERSGRWLWRRAGNPPNVQVWSLDALPESNPLMLQRSGSWYASGCAVDPLGNWLACSTNNTARLTFWPMPADPPSVIPGYEVMIRLVTFSPDSKWLATSWKNFHGMLRGQQVEFGSLRLWPMPGNGTREVLRFDFPNACEWTGLSFDPAGRFLFAIGNCSTAVIVPLDGSPVRRLTGLPGDPMVFGCAVSPSGLRVATAFGFGGGERSLCVWDVETGQARVFPLPEPDPPEDPSAAPTGFEGGIQTLLFEDETTVLSCGDGGIRRWDLETGFQKRIWQVKGNFQLLQRNSKSALVLEIRETTKAAPRALWVDLATGASKTATEISPTDAPGYFVRDSVTAIAESSGMIRVGQSSGIPPHILAGHAGPAQCVATSPDLKWVASTGEDNTLRLWPMPDLSKPPLHTLPHDELIAKLKSLTNLRAVPDPAAENGWKIELDKFPGWKEVPTW